MSRGWTRTGLGHVFGAALVIGSLVTGADRLNATELWTGNDDHNTRTPCILSDGIWSELCGSPVHACLSHVWGSWWPLEGFSLTPVLNSNGTVKRYDCWIDPRPYNLQGATFGISRICDGQLSSVPCAPPEDKSFGKQCPSDQVGNPISVATGNKYMEVADFATAGPDVLEFRRYYNSRDIKESAFFGFGWRSNYDRSVFLSPDGLNAYVRRPNGQAFRFLETAGLWEIEAGNNDVQLGLV